MFIVVLFLIAFGIFLKISDSSFNLWFWNRVGRKSEDAHYRGKIVWIIGASSGIGEDISIRLARFSPLLILSARRTELLETVAKKCKDVNSDCQVKILPFDMVDFENLNEKTKEADEMYKRKVDIVVLNAGRSQRAEWTDIDPSVDIDCITINAVAPTQVARSILKNRGLHPTGEKTDNLQFVIISSVAGLLPAILSPSYAAAKAALMQYFRLLAVEMGEKGVKVSIICPSHVYAPNMLKSAFTSTPGAQHGEVIDAPRKAQMMPERAAKLISLAAVNEIHECVIASTPSVLATIYFFINFPGVFARIINLVGAKRLRSIRSAHE
ncbi:hypothetical protein PFISCL1PPCAC_1559 [Pristionchus fissidentatus]|uniref:Dehydrogenase n=1 Tax=Pristionchus fissidentatus TaxID=1538716 RepID=A0AAV5UUM3_9BILA|nr:hypothetical protein PFISCL1PPCAC_1559 [Pristionchus fissidentatus]